jgi:tRNA(adenine34) deaminase
LSMISRSRFGCGQSASAAVRMLQKMQRRYRCAGWRILPGMAASGTDEQLMRRALRLAEQAAQHGDVPIGAVVARGDEVLGEAGNERELRRDPTAHAEVLALRQASERLGGWRLLDTAIYVTLEPCPMCAGAISLARVPRLVYGAADPKGGAVGGVVDLFAESVVNHRPAVEAGLLGEESAALLESFFSARR